MQRSDHTTKPREVFLVKKVIIGASVLNGRLKMHVPAQYSA